MSSGVEFDEDTIGRAQRPTVAQQTPSSQGSAGFGMSVNPNDPKMIQWLMRRGFARSPNAAQGILILVIILNVIITYALISYFIL